MSSSPVWIMHFTSHACYRSYTPLSLPDSQKMHTALVNLTLRVVVAESSFFSWTWTWAPPGKGWAEGTTKHSRNWRRTPRKEGRAQKGTVFCQHLPTFSLTYFPTILWFYVLWLLNCNGFLSFKDRVLEDALLDVKRRKEDEREKGCFYSELH